MKPSGGPAHARRGWMSEALVKSDLLLMKHKDIKALVERPVSKAKQTKCVSPAVLGRHNCPG